MRFLSVCLVLVAILIGSATHAYAEGSKFRRGVIYDMPVNKIEAYIAERLKANVGKRHTMIFIYASWCPTCQKDFPEMIKFARHTNTDIIAISVDKDSGQLMSFLTGMYKYMDFPAIRLVPGGPVGLRNVLARYRIMYPEKVPYKAIFDKNAVMIEQGNLNLENLQLKINQIPLQLKADYKAAITGAADKMYIFATKLQQKNMGYQTNDELAYQWYERAAKRGYDLALVRIALFYQKGMVVKQDAQKAFDMLEALSKFSSKTSPDARALAQAFLSFSYANAVGVNKNLNLSYFWCYAALKSQKLPKPEELIMMEHLANLRTKISPEWQKKIETDVVMQIVETTP